MRSDGTEPDAEPGAVVGAVEALRCGTGAPDRRVAGVLYWYALSNALAGVAAAGRDASTVTIHSGHGGWPELGERAPSDDPYGAFARRCHALIPVLAAASGASERSLWAVTTDSIASVALGATDPDAAAAEALRACGPEAPAARFEQVPGRGTVVRRGSCCLLYLCPGMTKCLSCPRQTPQERRARLA
ncbi:Fe-S oxidoreductase [Tsukamurella pulmonis]|uniref:(2Fe-2S)-binding protein n=1 Tax=Tsukamurella pulmonis TaxID=47312 RepID=UPI001EDFEBD8|nr:(2Fe-2S)-binding protein [Tsukamurella pulmonis]BDD82913.1 Fe-S oxidoreductase [Tsukamurella pulmonis]